MKIFDVHVHLFPDKVAKHAASNISEFYGGIPMAGDGTLDTLIQFHDRAGVNMFALHSAATTPAQVSHANSFIMGVKDKYPDRVIPFATIHPDLEGMKDYVDSAIAQGFRGFKIHPDIQGFQIDSPKSMEMISHIEGKLPLIIHAGDARYDNSGPARIAHVIDEFPKLKLICAHLGGYSEWDDATRILADRDMLVDTSSSMFALDPARVLEIIRIYGAEKVLFGSDYPMWDAGKEIESLYSLGLTDDELKMILWDNAAKLFDL